MAKLPVKIRKAAQKALSAGNANVPTYRLLEFMAGGRGSAPAESAIFDTLKLDERLEALKNTADLLRVLEEAIEKEEAAKAKKEAKEKNIEPEPEPTPAPVKKGAKAQIDKARNIKIFTDGACSGNPGPMGIGFVIEDVNGNVLHEEARAIGSGTNNIAEYSALIAALDLVKTWGKKNVFCFSDSELMVKQINGIYKVKAPMIQPLIKQVQALRQKFDKFQITHVRREFNSRADGLASGALKRRKS